MNETRRAQQLFAIRLSLLVGFAMLAGKTYAYHITGSAAILSDAAESVVHVVAVAFAAFSLWLSQQPADQSHPYGHDKISFFSAGVEGALIALAAAFIIFEAVRKWLAGLRLENLHTGTYFVVAATLINAALGGYLVWQGRRHSSLILVANGKHVLTDSWTSLGVIVGLVLVMLTGWRPFDPIVAILVATNILWTGGKLVRQSVGGLMDEADAETERRIRATLDAEVQRRGLSYHAFRCRNSGTLLWVEFHLLFPHGALVDEAHWQATAIETAIQEGLPVPANIITHIEPFEAHDRAHRH